MAGVAPKRDDGTVKSGEARQPARLRPTDIIKLLRRILGGPPFSPRLTFFSAVLVCVIANSACLVRTRGRVRDPRALRTATLEELTEKIERFDSIQSMKATVTLQLSVVTEDEEKVQDFRDVKGFVLVRRPRSIRIVAQVPVVATTAFEMASDGKEFQVYLAAKNRFLVGDSNVKASSSKRADNVRPHHILEALLIDPPQSAESKRFLASRREGNRAYQIVSLLREVNGGALKLSREIWFDRAGLDIARLIIFDDTGEPVTIARYADWSEQDLLPFPARVSISRPKDGYELQVRILKPGLNEEVPEDRFQLKPPPGVRIQRVGETSGRKAVASSAHD